MAQFSYKDQARLLNKFLRSKIQDMERATDLVLQESGKLLAKETKKQMSRFKGNNKGFKKSVKAKFYRARGGKPAAAIIRVGVPFLTAFEEGAEVRGNPTLIIRLSGAEALGLPRVSKKTTWAMIWDRIKPLKPRIAKGRNGVVIYAVVNGRPTSLYKFQKAPVRVPKKLNFYQAAEDIAADIPTEIEKLLYGNY